MWRYLKLIGLFARVSIQDDAAYRVDFLVHILLSVVQIAGELMGLWIIFSNTRTLAGWTTYDVLALLGVFRIMAGVIALIIAPNMRMIMSDIREGTLDYVLLKPIHGLFYASVRRVVVWRVTDILLGIGLASYACAKLSTRLSPGTILLFVGLLMAGALILYSLWLVLATCAFWFTRLSNIEMVFWNVFEAGRYPVDIYRPSVRFALTYLVPLAFLTTIPAGVLLGKAEPAGVFTALVFSIVTLAGATMFFRRGIRHYSGASA